MLDDLRGDFDQHVAPLLRDIIDDTQKLLRQEFALAKVEVREDAKRMREILAYSLAGAVAVVLSLALLAVSAALLLVSAMPSLQPWVAFAAVAFVCAACGLVFMRIVSKKSRNIRFLSEQTIESLREDAEWIRGQTLT